MKNHNKPRSTSKRSFSLNTGLERLNIIVFVLLIAFCAYLPFSFFKETTDSFTVQDKHVETLVVRDSTLILYYYVVKIDGEEYGILNYPNKEVFDKIKVGETYLFSINNNGGIYLKSD